MVQEEADIKMDPPADQIPLSEKMDKVEVDKTEMDDTKINKTDSISTSPALRRRRRTGSPEALSRRNTISASSVPPKPFCPTVVLDGSKLILRLGMIVLYISNSYICVYFLYRYFCSNSLLVTSWEVIWSIGVYLMCVQPCHVVDLGFLTLLDPFISSVYFSARNDTFVIDNPCKILLATPHVRLERPVAWQTNVTCTEPENTVRLSISFI